MKLSTRIKGGVPLSRLRLVPILIVLVISLAVLFGGWQAYRHYNVVGPLQMNLEKIQGVQTVNIDGGTKNTIVVRLSKVADLQTTYDSISSAISDAAGTTVNIRIEDNRTSTLISDYEQLQPILFQGLAQGNYTTMIHNVEAAGNNAGVQTRVTMDDKHVFIQLAKDGHYLYKVQPYTMRQGDESA
jgi:hypothetical protein